MSFSRILKSIFCGAVFLLLVIQGFQFLSDLPAAERDGLVVPTDFDLFVGAMWSWAVLSAFSGTLAGLMHAPALLQDERHAYLATIEVLFWVWLAFFVQHLLALAALSVHGALWLTAASGLVTATWLALWYLGRPVQVRPPQEDPFTAGWTV